MLQSLLAEQQIAFNQSCVGQELEVLFEAEGRRGGQLLGRSPFMQAVHVAAPARLKGRLLPVRIESAHPNSLAGRLSEAAGEIGGTWRDARDAGVMEVAS